MASTRVPRLPATPASNTILLDDRRFHDLLPDEDWGRLPLAIWRRFSKRFADGETVVYVGKVEEACFSRAGWWLAQLARADRRAVADRRRDRRPDGRDGDRGCGERRPDLDPHLRAQQRISASHPLRETLRRADRAGGICRPWRQHGVADLGRARSAGVSQRRLFPADRAVAIAAAAMASRPAISP